jgi:Flp pilus assembly protein TadB
MQRRHHVGLTIAGVIVGLIVLAWLPWYVTALIIIAAIAIPAAAYRMLDPSQRRRLRNIRNRQVGRLSRVAAAARDYPPALAAAFSSCL